MWSSKRHLFVDLASDSPSSTGPGENMGTAGDLYSLILLADMSVGMGTLGTKPI
jgi:hypothetical protein